MLIFACDGRHVCDFSSWPTDFSVCFDSEELERPQWGWEDISMAVSTQLGLLLWKNFTYRRRQTVSTTAARHHRWGRKTHTLHVKKGSDVILSNGESLTEDVLMPHFHPPLPSEHRVLIHARSALCKSILTPGSSHSGAFVRRESIFPAQFGRLAIKPEPPLKATAKAVQQLGQLLTTIAYSWLTQTVTLVFIPSPHVCRAG